MKSSKILLLGLLTTLSAIHTAFAVPTETGSSADVIVYGGTSGGVIAAVAAARQGKKVILIEQGQHLGGMSSGGLGWTDNGATDTIGGLSREFYERIYRYYANKDAWKFQTREQYADWLKKGTRSDGQRIDELKAQFLFEPHAAEQVFNEMAREAGVTVVFGERLDLQKGVRKEGNKITAIVMESGRVFTGKVFLDTTYEGDLMAKSGVSYIVGREPNSRYGETLNGALPFTPAAFPKISPYVVAGDKSSGLLPRVEPQTPGTKGIGDHRVQTYNFRLCLTDVPENRVPLTKPANYNPLDFELLARFIGTLTNVKPGPRKNAAIGLRGNGNDLGINFELVPNCKTDSNCGSEFGSDYFGRSYDWPNADYAGRQKIWDEHKNYTLGMLWFLANDPRVPAAVRTEMQRWGFAKDEFADSDHFPRQLYVREARRMISDYVVTEHEAWGERVAEDPIALASYPLDSHGVTLFVDEAGVLHRERGYFVGIRPFPISYRAITPRAAECQNLLVPCCLSSSHASFGCVRMEPVFMMLGHAAGTAASQSIDKQAPVQEISYPALRDRLLADRQILSTKNSHSPATVKQNKQAAPADPQLTAALQKLVQRKLIDAPDYWVKRATEGQECQGYMVEALLLAMAKTFGPAYTRPDIVRNLHVAKVIESVPFWEEHTISNKNTPGTAIRETILRFISVTEAAQAPANPDTWDLVVYGGTSGAITAAVQAKKMGKSVVVICPDKHLGGLSSGGLGYTDTGNKSVIGGLSREFYHRVWKHYDQAAAWKFQKKEDYGNKGQGTPAIDGAQRTQWIFEPHVAEQVFEDFVKENNIPVHRDEWLDRAKGVEKTGSRITAIKMLSGNRYAGRMFIDATYEGDLLAAAGLDYHVGRESNSVYGEEHNGVQTGVLHHRHHFGFLKEKISPYVVPGDPKSGILPRISQDPPGEFGMGDKRVQAYCYRMCLTNHGENRVPFAKPEGYDPKQYELLVRIYAAGWRETFEKFDPIPNHKTDTNNHGPFSTDNIGYSYDYPEASYERRREILREHQQYQQGWLYFITTDPRIPKDVQDDMKKWGLAKDEFKDNGNWPHQIYVREARRLIGQYVMTEKELRKQKPTPESVGMGSYTIDSHNVQRYITPEGYVQNEGDIGVSTNGPYEIAYGSLVPKKAQCENLLVPVCLSSTHIAFGSIRMEPVFMILGQSAATAAVMAIDNQQAVQDVPYAKLRERLLADGQVLEFASDPAPARAKGNGRGAVDWKSLPGVVVDDSAAKLTGEWKASHAAATWIGEGYRHESDTRDGKATATFTAKLPDAGLYEVRLAYTPNANRTSKAAVQIDSAMGKASITVNQREAPPIDGNFIRLGTFAFSPDRATVTISNQGSDGFVVIDAVQWLPVGK